MIFTGRKYVSRANSTIFHGQHTSFHARKKKIVHVTFFGVSRVPFAKFGHGLLSMSRVKISEIGHAHCHGLLWGLILSRVTSRVTRYFLGFGHGLLKKCHVEKKNTDTGHLFDIFARKSFIFFKYLAKKNLNKIVT